MSTSDPPSYVLGVNSGPHDGSAALLRDGEILAMVEQEKLSRNKRALGESPSDAINACLRDANIDLDSVDEIAIGWDVPSLSEIEGVDFDEAEFVAWLLGSPPKHAREMPPVRYVDHHLAHAASAFYTSGFDEAAILVVDGRGETVATTLAVGTQGGIEVIQTWGTELSLGHYYGWAAEWAGFTHWDAGKLMGLASYGVACQPVPVSGSQHGYSFAIAPPSGRHVAHHFVQSRSQLRNWFRTHNYPFTAGGAPEVMAHVNFAASIQRGLETALSGLLDLAKRTTGQSNLVLAGGVALNCTANGKLIRSGLFEEVWIPPFPHDAGVSLGAALAAVRDRGHQRTAPTRLGHAFWAPTSRALDIDAISRIDGCEIVRFEETELRISVAEHLASGKLVGWWQGRCEIGQRALGARSILCDPRRRNALAQMNSVKGREIWRPLAPSVLVEHAGEIFDGPLPTAAEFMLAAWPVRSDAQTRIPAAVHVDGTARPQLVQAKQERFHGLIQEFREQTGVPAIINTSFNLAGEPVVLSQKDAISTFLRSELDVLVLDDLVILKPDGDRMLPRPDRRHVPVSFVPWSQ